jgi:carboxymethylenebutenolidase
MGTTINLTAVDGHQFGAYQAPHEGAYKGGLVLIQEIFGVTPHIKELCDEFASLGYDVLGPAIFDRIERDASFGYDEDQIKKSVAYASKSGVDTPMQDIQACVDHLKSNGPVAVTGFCYGGSLVWMSAARVNGLSCAVGYYGRLIPEYLDEQPRCPTQLHFGSRDGSIPLENVEKIRERHAEVDIHVFDAEHGFCSDRPQNHSAEAKAAALALTIGFLDRHMIN